MLRLEAELRLMNFLRGHGPEQGAGGRMAGWGAVAAARLQLTTPSSQRRPFRVGGELQALTSAVCAGRSFVKDRHVVNVARVDKLTIVTTTSCTASLRNVAKNKLS